MYDWFTAKDLAQDLMEYVGIDEATNDKTEKTWEQEHVFICYGSGWFLNSKTKHVVFVLNKEGCEEIGDYNWDKDTSDYIILYVPHSKKVEGKWVKRYFKLPRIYYDGWYYFYSELIELSLTGEDYVI